MKKIIMAATAALALSMSAMAQDLSFIVNLGYQGSNLTNINTGNAKAELLSGFRGGAALDWTFTDLGVAQLSLQPGVYFSMKGAKLASTKSGNDKAVNFVRQLNYIDIPVLLNARFGIADHTNVFVNAGPYLGFGINGSDKVTKGTDTKSSGSVDFFKDKVYNRFDWGLHIGTGVEFNHFMLGVGYQLGLQDISKGVNMTTGELSKKIEDWARSTFAEKTNNSNFFVTVGYRF